MQWNYQTTCHDPQQTFKQRNDQMEEFWISIFWLEIEEKLLVLNIISYRIEENEPNSHSVVLKVTHMLRDIRTTDE